MEILARYIHGSADSRDSNVLYIVDDMPSEREAPVFCNGDPGENRNVAVVREGVVARCFKGFPDEVNNALMATYPLHPQAYPLLITRAVARDVVLKQLSVLRKLVMELRHTPLRLEAHRALKGGYGARMRLARAADLRALSWALSDPEHLERRKCMAFQLGQALGLYRGEEYYTKQAIAAAFPALADCLRREDGGMAALQAAKEAFLNDLAAQGLEDCGDRTAAWACGGVRRRVSLRGRERYVEEGEGWS